MVSTITTELGEWVIRNIEPLTHNNYETWSSGMFSYFERKGLIMHIHGGLTLLFAMLQPHESVWNDHAEVCEVIKRSCSPEILPYIIHEQYPDDAWYRLREAVNASEDEKREKWKLPDLQFFDCIGVNVLAPALVRLFIDDDFIMG